MHKGISESVEAKETNFSQNMNYPVAMTPPVSLCTCALSSLTFASCKLCCASSCVHIFKVLFLELILFVLFSYCDRARGDGTPTCDSTWLLLIIQCCAVSQAFLGFVLQLIKVFVSSRWIIWQSWKILTKWC